MEALASTRAPELLSREGLRLDIPGLQIKSEANQRGRWGAGAKRASKQRDVVAALLSGCARRAIPCEVRIVRVAPGRLDDDNLARACKAVRDEVAVWLGVDDGDPRISWVTAQEKSKTYGARIIYRFTGDAVPSVTVTHGPERSTVIMRLTREQIRALAEDLDVAASNGFPRVQTEVENATVSIVVVRDEVES